MSLPADLQGLQAIVDAMRATKAALPALEPYIVAEGAEGVAYRRLPTPKASVLTSITALVGDLEATITSVGLQDNCFDDWLGIYAGALQLS